MSEGLTVLRGMWPRARPIRLADWLTAQDLADLIRIVTRGELHG